MGQHSKYSFKVKLAAIIKYLEGSCSTRNAGGDYPVGKGTLREIQEKYGTRSDKQFRNWIMKYNDHGELKASGICHRPFK